MTEEDDFVRITLRLPKALHAALNEAAAKKRSMNAEIIARLEETFAEPSEQAGRDAMAASLYPLLVEMVEAYQRGEKPVISFKRKQRPEKPE